MVCLVFEDHIYLLQRVDAVTNIIPFNIKQSKTELDSEIEKCTALSVIRIFSLSFLQVKCFLLRWLWPIWHQIICFLPGSALLWALGGWPLRTASPESPTETCLQSDWANRKQYRTTDGKGKGKLWVFLLYFPLAFAPSFGSCWICNWLPISQGHSSSMASGSSQ